MLVRLARRTHIYNDAKVDMLQGDAPASFEDALRHDLASRRVIAYESVVGGASKRFFDVSFAVFTAPFWTLAILIAIAVAKVRAPRGVTWRVVTHDACAGYGGRIFKRWGLKLSAPEQLGLGGQVVQVMPDWRLNFVTLVQRLPEIINVLAGEMSFVGPRPIARAVFGDLGSFRKYYASARPGLLSASDCGPADDMPTLLYRVYAKQWSIALDWLIIRHALSPPKGRGES